jgi:hypothetical protein
VQRGAELWHVWLQRVGQRCDQLEKAQRGLPCRSAVIEHQRVHRWQVPSLRVLLAILLTDGDHVTQELNQRPVLRVALVLEQQVDEQLAVAEGGPTDQVRAILAQVLGHMGSRGDMQRREIDLFP